MLFGLSLSFFLSQILAGIALVSDILSFQFKKREHILIFFLISATCIALHYFLLGRYTAAVIIGIGIIRFLVSLRTTNFLWVYIFIGCYTLATYVFFKDTYDILILLALSFSTLASFQKTDKILRYLMMIGTSVTIVYNYFVFSPIGILLEAVFLISNLVGFYRHYIAKGTIGTKG